MAKKEESTALADVKAELEARLKAQAAVRDQMAGSNSYISFKGGHLTIDGTAVPSGEVEILPLAIVFERTWYEGDYNPDKPQTPACYTFNANFPHAEAGKPQNATCKGCPHDEWGSGPRGKGKACRESARLAVIAADADPLTASIYTAKIPISSLGTVKDFIAYCGSNGKLTGQIVTKLKVMPDAKTIFKVSMTPLRETTTDLLALLPRLDAAVEVANTPYPVFEEQVANTKY